MQSKLSVLMPSIKFVNKCIQSGKFSQVVGHRGAINFTEGATAPLAPLGTAPDHNRLTFA